MKSKIKFLFDGFDDGELTNMLDFLKLCNGVFSPWDIFDTLGNVGFEVQLKILQFLKNNQIIIHYQKPGLYKLNYNYDNLVKQIKDAKNYIVR